MKKCYYCKKWLKQKDFLKEEKITFHKLTKREKLIISMKYCGHCKKLLEVK